MNHEPWDNEEEKALAISQLIAQTDVWLLRAKSLEAELAVALERVDQGSSLVKEWASPGTVPFLIIDGGVSDDPVSEES